MDRDARTALAVLARLDLLQAAAILRGGLPDPVFLMAVLAAAGAIAFGGGQLALAAHSFPQTAQAVVAVASFLAFGLVHARLRAESAAVVRGPFGELILRRRVRAAWLVVRAAACLVPLIVLGAFGAVASAGLADALLLSACAIGGMVLAATVHFWAVRLGGTRSGVRPTRALSAVRASPRVVRPHVALIAWVHLRRRIAGVPAWLAIVGCWTVAALAAALAHQNSGALVATAVALVLALPGLALLSWTDVPLIQILGREPVSLAALLGCFLGAPAVGAAGMFAVALAAGLGAGPALGLATGVGLGLGLFAVFLTLNALIRRPGVAAAAASVDFAASVGLLLVTPWAALWTLIRLPMLARSAAARRWLDA